MMDHPDIRHSPAAERNQGPLLAVLQSVLPDHGVALEIASGGGQHALHFAAGLPGWTWLCSDRDAASRASVTARRAAAPPDLAARIGGPLDLDVTADTWPLPAEQAQVDAIFCANMLHASPWATCGGLMRGAARHLAPQGLLLTYGPYLVSGLATAPSNLAFDADLKARDPSWGLRALDDVLEQAQACGLQLRERMAMPSNNWVLVFHRASHR